MLLCCVYVGVDCVDFLIVLFVSRVFFSLVCGGACVVLCCDVVDC